MNAEDKRVQRLQLLEDHIGQSLREAEANGEIRSAPSFGKPLDFGDGYDDTPAELRMPMKVLKDAGVLPPEVEVMRQLAGLRSELAAVPEGTEAHRALRQRISEKEQLLALRLEKLRLSGSL